MCGAQVFDALNQGLLSALCADPDKQLDSVVLHQQPSGSHGHWATEIWDTTRVCVLRGVRIRSGPHGEVVGGPLWLNGSRCARTRHEEYRRCYACEGSRLQHACKAPDWRRPAAAAAARRGG